MFSCYQYLKMNFYNKSLIVTRSDDELITGDPSKFMAGLAAGLYNVYIYWWRGESPQQQCEKHMVMLTELQEILNKQPPPPMGSRAIRVIHLLPWPQSTFVLSTENSKYVNRSHIIYTHLKLYINNSNYMHTSQIICTLLKLYAQISNYLQTSQIICKQLKLSANISHYMQISQIICTQLKLYLELKLYVQISNYPQKSQIIRNNLKLSTNISNYLQTSRIICKHLKSYVWISTVFF